MTLTLLDEAVLTTLAASGRGEVRRTLPGVLAGLVRGEIAGFPAVRPHQRHAWHAFLVQLAALASLDDDPQAPPDDEAAWRDRLLALTPDHPDGVAWALVSPPDRPAFLQPPVPGGSLAGFKTVGTPGRLDMLVTAKNHDVKADGLMGGRLEHWILALVSLQTQEGFLGAGNYGISRMNGGFASRPGLGVEPGFGPSHRFRRDLRRMAEVRPDMVDIYGYPARGGLGLVWLEPWDGTVSIDPRRLDPFYIEICRRVRLTGGDDEPMAAQCAGSQVARIDAKAMKGRTGDPWTPLVPDGDSHKALTVDAEGFSYRRIVRLLFPRRDDGVRPAAMQAVTPDDDEAGLSILARALVRGQGKTEGYFERRVPISKTKRVFLRPDRIYDKAAACAHDRVRDAASFARGVLFPSVMAGVAATSDTVRGWAARASRRFDGAVDEGFFAALDAELEVLDDDAACQEARARWLLALRDIGREVLSEVLAAAPHAAARSWRTRVNAREIFEACFWKTFGAAIPEAMRHPPAVSATPDHEVSP
jgi:CRISPR system Cascade subunit CasA